MPEEPNLANLALLPKGENCSKNNKTLQEITDPWLQECIKKYEFIDPADYVEYSNVNNYQKLFAMREEKILEAYREKRSDLLNN